jgi:hypothetical protein
MRRALLIVLVVACGEKKKGEEIQIAMPDPVVGSGASGEAPVDAAPRAKLELSEDVGPPAPFEKLRPRMKQADVLAILADANVRPALSVPDDFSFGENQVYETGQPGVLAALSYVDGRIVRVTIQAIDEGVLTAVRDRWGKPATVDPNAISGYETTWRAGATGWTASLYTRPPPNASGLSLWKITELELETTTERAGATVAVDDLFAKLVPLVGSSLVAAERTFGPGLRREIADTDESAAERGEARQGFATVTVPWSPGPWELVLSPEPAADRIRTIVLRGATADEAGRVGLFGALRKALGVEPRAVVSEAGRFEVQLATATVLVRVAEPSENQWNITIQRAKR